MQMRQNIRQIYKTIIQIASFIVQTERSIEA